MEHFEDTFRKLLKVPKSEVDDLREKRRRLGFPNQARAFRSLIDEST